MTTCDNLAPRNVAHYTDTDTDGDTMSNPAPTPIEHATAAAQKLGWEVVVFLRDVDPKSARAKSHAVVCLRPDAPLPLKPYVVHILHTFEDGTTSGLSHGDYDLTYDKARELADARFARGY